MVDWSKYEHAYGDASDLPAYFAELRSNDADVRREAMISIDHAVIHQGGGYSVAPFVAAPLIEIVSDASVGDRHRILDFLARLGEEHRWNKRGLSDRMGPPNKFYADILDKAAKVLEDAYHATRKGVPVYLELLHSPDAAVRREAAHLVAWFEEDRATTTKPLLEAYAKETEPNNRATMILALGVLWRHLVTHHEPVPEELRRAVSSALEATERTFVVVGAIARTFAGEPPDEATLLVLADAVVDAPDAELAWERGHLGTAAAHSIGFLHRSGDPRAAALAEHAFARVVIRDRTARDREAWDGTIFDYALAMLLGIHFYDFPKGATWNAEQRRILSWLVQLPLLHFNDLDTNLGRYGQPAPREIAAELGVSLPALPAALAQPKIRDLTLRAREDVTLVEEIAALLPAVDIVELIEEGYCLETVSQDLPWLRALVLLLPDRIDGRAALLLLAERLATKGALRRTRIRSSLFQCVAMAGARVPAMKDEHIEKLLLQEPRVFEFPAFELLRGAVARLSLEARVRVLAELETTSFAEPNEPWALFDLIPSAVTAKRLLALVEDEENEPFFLGAGAARVVEILAAQGPDATPLLVASAMRLENKLRAVVFGALATIEGGSTELAAFASDPDPRFAAIAKKGRLEDGDLLELGIDPTSTDRGGRAKGGVIGRDGKPWRG